MKRSSVATFVCGSIIFFSCQKQVNFNFPPADSNQPSPADSVYFSKFYYVENADTVAIWSASYDSRRRVTVFSDSFDLQSPDYAAEIYMYQYNGNDSLPFRTILHTIDLPGPDYYDTTYNFYDNVGRLIKDSTIEVGNIRSVRKFSYGVNKIYGENYNIQNGLFIPGDRDTATLDARGNVISDKQYQLNGSTYDLVAETQFSYDTRENAFRYVNVRKLLFQFSSRGSDALYERAIGQNNISAISGFDPFTGMPTTSTLTYTYNSRNQPARAVFSFGTGNDAGVFRYIALP